MAPDPSILLEKSNITTSLIGLYDVPRSLAGDDIVLPGRSGQRCVFQFYDEWMKGKHCLLSMEEYGCGGCGRAFFGLETRSREEFIKFLAETEGLRESAAAMERWIDHVKLYKPEHDSIVIGPLREDLYPYLKTVTFFVDGDGLSVMVYGANYHAEPQDPDPVIAPFGSGCMQLLSVFRDLSTAQAAIGSTDIAMRKFLPPGIIAFTVTVPMYERLCSLDERSFLYKPFLAGLGKAREGEDYQRVREQ